MARLSRALTVAIDVCPNRRRTAGPTHRTRVRSQTTIRAVSLSFEVVVFSESNTSRLIVTSVVLYDSAAVARKYCRFRRYTCTTLEYNTSQYYGGGGGAESNAYLNFYTIL